MEFIIIEQISSNYDIVERILYFFLCIGFEDIYFHKWCFYAFYIVHMERELVQRNIVEEEAKRSTVYSEKWFIVFRRFGKIIMFFHRIEHEAITSSDEIGVCFAFIIRDKIIIESVFYLLFKLLSFGFIGIQDGIVE